MIAIRDLHHYALEIKSLSIDRGITSIIGPNGSGKTTFLKICAGIIEPESGIIRINGVPPRKCEIGWVNEFPDRNMLFGIVEDEIASPLRFRHVPCRQIRQRVRKCMEDLGIESLAERSIREISGGEKILVSLATALIGEPEILILDEYDSHLDTSRIEYIEELLRESSVSCIVRCTQQMETAARGDFLLYLDAGKVVRSGTPDNVFREMRNTPFYPMSWRCCNESHS